MVDGPILSLEALDALARNDRVKVSEKVRGSPVHVAEVARVIHGIIDQMGAGAPRSGVYHYSGIGEVNAYSFMETVLANASQYQPFKDARELMELVTFGGRTRDQSSLDCAAIRHQVRDTSSAGGSLFPAPCGATLTSTQRHRKRVPVSAALKTAVLTVSDTRTVDTDTSGAFLEEALLAAGHEVVDRQIVIDDVYQLRAIVSRWIADAGVEAILTTGGTGFSGRDSTPEALSPLFDKTIDGFGEVFRALSLTEIGSSTVQSAPWRGSPMAR